MLRASSFAALAALAMRLWFGAEGAGTETSTDSSHLDSALVSWAVTVPSHVTVDADTIPTLEQRDWLLALRRTGTNVRWTTADSNGGALVVEPGAQPALRPPSSAPGRVR